MRGDRKPRTAEELARGWAYIDRIIEPVLARFDARLDAIIDQFNRDRAKLGMPPYPLGDPPYSRRDPQ